MGRSIVIILAEQRDIHALTVARRIESRGGRAVILDTADFPCVWSLSLYFSSAHSAMHFDIRLPNERIASEDVASIWWRRIQPHRIDKEVVDTRHRDFCIAEARAAFRGWVYSMRDRVVNPLTSETSAKEKPLQLKAAIEAGLRIPESCISNDPDAVRSFTSKNTPAVFKVLTGTKWRFTETRRFDLTRHNDNEAIRLAPCIYQESIDNSIDIRVTIVGNKLFAAEMRPVQSGAELDWRLDPTVETRPHVLPTDTANKLQSLMDRLGLVYGAADLRLKSDGEYVFLEVNPGGQWLFAEIHANHPISDAFADLLLSVE